MAARRLVTFDPKPEMTALEIAARLAFEDGDRPSSHQAIDQCAPKGLPKLRAVFVERGIDAGDCSLDGAELEPAVQFRRRWATHPRERFTLRT